jgi:hypothetical protein
VHSNFLVVGAQKAGTTSLHRYMIEHPEIYLPSQKETKFFVDDRLYNKGIGFYKERHFSGWNGEHAVGEVDPEYMYYEKALDRIVQHFDVSVTKFIFLLRNPIDRAFSHYVMTYRRGRETLSFQDALAQEQERISIGYMENLHFSYAQRGYYLRQIERFLEVTPRENMLFLLSDDLKEDRQKCLSSVFSFLGVANDFVPSGINEQFHRSTWPRSVGLVRFIRNGGRAKSLLRMLVPSRHLRDKMRRNALAWNQTQTVKLHLSEDARRHLALVFKEENARLAAFLGRDLSHWK